MKPFALGITVGRFQTFHLGHADMIEKAVAVCERVGVFVGSSQESGTAKNPFTYEQRERYLRRVFGDAIEIYPLPAAPHPIFSFRARRNAASAGSTASTA